MTLATNKMKPRRPNKYCTSKCHLKTSSKFTKCCPKYCTSHEKDLQHFSHPRLPTSEQGAQYTAPATQIKKCLKPCTRPHKTYKAPKTDTERTCAVEISANTFRARLHFKMERGTLALSPKNAKPRAPPCGTDSCDPIPPAKRMRSAPQKQISWTQKIKQHYPPKVLNQVSKPRVQCHTVSIYQETNEQQLHGKPQQIPACSLQVSRLHLGRCASFSQPHRWFLVLPEAENENHQNCWILIWLNG